jgi:hypothetical protein
MDSMGNGTTPAPKPLAELYVLWDRLGDVPVSSGADGVEPDSIEEPFLMFPVGTPREEIWHWFERQNRAFSVGDVQRGLRQ